MRPASLFILLPVFFAAAFIFPEKAPAPTPIQFEIKDSAFFIGKEKFDKADLKKVKALLGEPDQVFKYKHMVTMRRWEANADGSKGPCEFYDLNVTDYYYLFNKVGLMLYTQNGQLNSSEPTEMIVRLGKKRAFDHDEQPHYFPAKQFSGVFLINGDTISSKEIVLPKEVNYNTKEFRLYHSSCWPASYSMTIDRVYCRDKKLFIIYLDNAKDQRVSYIKVF